MNINDFKEITSADFNAFKKCNSGRYINSESSLATMYMWQHYADVKYCVNDETIFSLYKNNNGNLSSFMPYGDNAKTEYTIDKLLSMYITLNQGLVLNLCTEDFVNFLLDSKKYSITITENRNLFDYVYRTKDLIELKGKKYHSKKNHINSFRKKYNYEYLKYDNSMKHECIDFCKSVIMTHYKDNTDGFNTELASIQKTFNYIQELNLVCGILKLDNKIIALSVGERLNDDYALIHIEKADYNYREAYSVINKEFLKNEFPDTIYVNREEDMGIEGLRKAKLSYHPCKMINKYTVEFNL